MPPTTGSHFTLSHWASPEHKIGGTTYWFLLVCSIRTVNSLRNCWHNEFFSEAPDIIVSHTGSAILGTEYKFQIVTLQKRKRSQRKSIRLAQSAPYSKYTSIFSPHNGENGLSSGRARLCARFPVSLLCAEELKTDCKKRQGALRSGEQRTFVPLHLEVIFQLSTTVLANDSEQSFSVFPGKTVNLETHNICARYSIALYWLALTRDNGWHLYKRE